MENYTVCRMACRPGSLPASFKILVTLMILATLASCVRDDKTDKSASMFSSNCIKMSKSDELTTTKSN